MLLYSCCNFLLNFQQDFLQPIHNLDFQFLLNDNISYLHHLYSLIYYGFLIVHYYLLQILLLVLCLKHSLYQQFLLSQILHSSSHHFHLLLFLHIPSCFHRQQVMNFYICYLVLKGLYFS